MDCIAIAMCLQCDLHRDCRADRLEIALIWSRIVYHNGLWCSLFDRLAILCTFAIQSQSGSTVLIEVDCNRIALNLQFHRNPQDCKRLCRHCRGFGWTALRSLTDCEWMPILGATGDVFLQFVDFPRFWCNPFNPLAILCGFAISPQFNSIVKIAIRIAVLIFSVSRTGLHCC